MNAMALAQDRCWYGMGGTLRSFAVDPVSPLPLSHHRGSPFSTNEPDQINDGEAYLSFSPSYLDAPEVPKNFNRITVNVRGKGWMEVRVNHNTRAAGWVAPPYIPATPDRNARGRHPTDPVNIPDFDFALDDVLEFDVNPGIDASNSRPADEQLLLELRFRGFAPTPSDGTTREFAITGVTVHYESRPDVLNAWTVGVTVGGDREEARLSDPAKGNPGSKSDIEDMLDKFPLYFEDDDGCEYLVALSRYDGQTDWVYEGDSTDVLTFVIRAIARLDKDCP